MLRKAKKYNYVFNYALATLSVGFIFYSLSQKSQAFFYAFENTSSKIDIHFFLIVFCLILFSSLNWLTEALKWHLLINSSKKESFYTSLKKSCISHAMGIFTPNKIGDYAAKICLYKGVKKTQLISLNFTHNLYQLCTTIIFGTIGVIVLLSESEFIELLHFKRLHTYVVLGLFGTAFILLVRYNKKLKPLFYSFSIKKEIHLFVFALSIAKYLLFSQLFVLLLVLLGVHLPLIDLFVGAWAMYLISSIIPTFFITDLVVKTGVAVFVFALVGVNEAIVIITCFLTWVFNFILPALLGNLWLLQQKTVQKKQNIII